MKNLVFLFGGILLCLFPSFSPAQSPSLPIRENQMWGIVDTSGKVIVPPLYERLESKKNHYQVRKNYRWGAIALNGKVVVPARYDKVVPWGNNGILIEENGLKGFASLPTGTFVEPQFHEISAQVNGEGTPMWARKELEGSDQSEFAVISDESGVVLDHLPSLPSFHRVESSEGDFFLALVADSTGKTLYALNQKEVRVKGAEELNPLSNQGWLMKQGEMWSLLNPAGYPLSENQYSSLEEIARGYLWFDDGQGRGTMSVSGEVFFKTEGQLVEQIGSNRLVLEEANGKSLVDLRGRKVYPAGYQHIARIGKSLLVLEKNNRWGVGDEDGKILVPLKYIELLEGYGDDLFRARKPNGWALIQQNGASTEITGMSKIAPFQGPLALIAEEGKVGLANFRGEMILEPADQKIQIGKGQIKIKTDKVRIRKYDEEGQLYPEKVFYVVADERESVDNLTRAPINNPIANLGFIWSEPRQAYGYIHPDNRDIRYKPQFLSVTANRDLGLSLVAIQQRGEYLYGVFNHQTGKFIQPPRFRWFEFGDYKDMPMARARLSNGMFVLVNRKGKLRNFKNMAWMGEPVDGIAPFNIGGKVREERVRGKSWIASTQVVRGLNGRGQTVYLSIEGGKWGYMSVEDGQVLLEPTYKWAQSFSDGYAKVVGPNGWGLIDTDFKVTIPTEYHSLSSIDHNGQRLWVPGEMPKEYGFMDSTSQMAILPRFEEVRPFSGGLAAVRAEGKWGYVDQRGDWVFEPDFDKVRDFRDGAAWAFKKKEAYILREDGSQRRVELRGRTGNFERGACWIELAGRKGLMDRNGAILVEPIYLDISVVGDMGEVAVRTGKGWGLLGKYKKWQLKPRYGDISWVENGIWKVKKGNEYGLVNGVGEWIRPLERCTIHESGNPNEGWIVQEKEAYVFFGPDGEEQFRMKLQQVRPFEEGLAAAKYEGKWGYLDSTGWAIPPAYESALPFSCGWAMVVQGGEEKIIDREGKVLQKGGIPTELKGRFLLPASKTLFYPNYKSNLMSRDYRSNSRKYKESYDQLMSSEYFFSVQFGSRWKLYDCDFYPVNSFSYWHPIKFSEGLAPVRHTGKYGLWTSEGEEILPVKYTRVRAYSNAIQVFSDQDIGYFRVGEGWIWGVGNENQ